MRFIPVRFRPLALLPAALFALAACTDEKIIVQDRPPFNAPADSVNGFLGLFTVDTKQTTCGNCHVGTQSQWVQHGHASAFEGLVDNVPNPPAFCYSCHTVSGRGNIAAETGQPAGWDLVQSASYRQVQCESCHGPGLAHVQNPQVEANWPLAHADVPVEAELESAENQVTCAGCHSDAHHPFAEQWKLSGHANEELAAEEGGNASCNGCHEGRQFIFNREGGASQTNFVEKSGTKMLSITCAACHDSHGSQFDGQLRMSLSAQNTQENLCGFCHLRPGRSTPSTSFSNSTATVLRRGPHASQGAVYFGTAAGYFPPGFVYDSTRNATSHSSSNVNPTLCAGCHVQAFEVNDPATGDFVLNAVGHTFQAVPCVDAQGAPTGANNCDYTSTARNWNGCTFSGCHTAGATVAASLFNNSRIEMQGYVNALWTDDGVLGTHGSPYISPATDTGLLPAILRLNLDEPANGCRIPNTTNPSKAFSATDNCVSVAEGALWNAQLFSENLYSQNDGSNGIHNPFFYRGILTATIQSVRNAYPAVAGSVTLPAEVEANIQKALSDPRTGWSQVRQTASR
jgi:predicted CXXCH cytochrome family protein